MSFKKKLIVLGILVTVIPLLLVTCLTWFLGRGLGKQVHKNVTQIATSDLDRSASDVYAMAKALNESLQEEVSTLLFVANDLLEKNGNVSFATDVVEWNAVNQITKESSKVTLPKVLVGKNWLGTVNDPKETVPVVDEFSRLAKNGYTCTIFQKMNDRGDMLRVATSVINLEGKRAIGTYIPASNEGQSSPIISAVLKGESFVGRAFVVDQWCATAYKPIFDSSRRVVGMLYVGKPEKKAFESIRNAILKTKVGETGYIYVLNTKGKARGNYVISGGGKRDGENILGAKDADGKEFIKEITEKAPQLKPGEIFEIRYPWQNSGETRPRMKIAHIAYYEAWDWAIGVGAYEDEIMAAPNMIARAMNRNYLIQIAVAIASLIGAVALFSIYGTGIANKISAISQMIHGGALQTREAAGEISKASQSLAEMASREASSIEETSASLEELSSMTKRNAEHAQTAKELSTSTSKAVGEGVREAEVMTHTIESVQKSSQELKLAMDQIQAASESISKVVKTIDEIAFQTNILALNAAVEAARAGEAGMGFAVVADEVRALAQRSAESAKETARLIVDSVHKSNAGVIVSQKVSSDLKVIIEEVAKVTGLLNHIGSQAKLVDESVGEIALASQEQNQGISQITTAVSQMDQATQTNAATSEEAASASEQLSAQSMELERAVKDLYRIILGKDDEERETSRTTSPRLATASAKQRKFIAKPERVALATPQKREENAIALPKPEAEEVNILKQVSANVAVKAKQTIPMEGDFKDF